MIRYAYLDKEKKFILRFNKYNVEVASTNYLLLNPEENHIDTNIGIWPTDGIICLFVTTHPNLHVFNEPICDKQRLVLSILNTYDRHIHIPLGRSIVKIYPVAAASLSKIEHQIVNSLLWEQD